ncbi:MAG: serine hydrolase domain-containing protein [Marinicella sp.]
MKRITLLLFIPLIAMAQIPDEVKKEIDLRIKHQINPSIVVGLFENRQSHFYTQGFQNKEKNLKANTDSVYEIGSISKTFTGLLLAQLIEEKQVELDGAVQAYWPEPFELVDKLNQPITLKQLSTHTSGLPRLPGNLPMFAKDPYAEYDREQLLLGIKMVQAQQSGSNYVYSNFAVGLLGETLAVVSGESYNSLIKRNILEPMSLNSTYMELDEVPQQHLAQGYSGIKAVEPWRFKALAGAGSIRSNITDLLAFGVSHLNPANAQLSTMTQSATSVHYQQGSIKVGLGWHIDTAGIIWHNGGTAGFKSIILIDPVQQKVAAGITNQSNDSIEDIVAHLMNHSQPMDKHDFPVEASVDHLRQYTGQFKLKNSDHTSEIRLINDQLFFTAPKQPKQRMTYVGNDTFIFKLLKVKIKFLKNSTEQISAYELMGWGEPQMYEKLSIVKN